MTSLLENIKSKFIIQKIVDYIPYNLYLILFYGSKNLLNSLDITTRTYQKYNIIKKIFESNGDIKKILIYLDVIQIEIKKEKNFIKYNEINNLNKILLSSCLNNAKFNIDFFIEKNTWEFYIKHIHNLKLIISSKLLDYINNLKEENNKYIFDILNIYRKNIVEISFNGFNNNELENNIKTINSIINILKRVYYVRKELKDIKYNNNKINDYYNNSNKLNIYYNKDNEFHSCFKIRKLSFDFFKITSCEDFNNNFLDKIDNIIPLNNISELFINIKSLEINQFILLVKYIIKKMRSIKYLKINNLNYNNNHYNALNILYSNLGIEKLDISNMFWPPILTSIINMKNNPFEILKLSLYFNEYINWDFLNESINSLEEFEIEIKENNNYYENIDNMIYTLNKMKRLKRIKILGGLKPNQLINFKNKNIKSIEYLNIDLNLSFDNVESYKNKIYKYFYSFENLKYFAIANSDSFYKNKFYNFIFPPKIIHLNLTNIDGIAIISLLKDNKKNLPFIEKLKINNSYFDKKNYDILIGLFIYFKSLIKLSINKINISASLTGVKEDYYFYKSIPNIIKNIPTILELDISNNEYKGKNFNNKIFQNIRLSMPKKLINLKIFDDHRSLLQNNINYLNDIFGPLID